MVIFVLASETLEALSPGERAVVLEHRHVINPATSLLPERFMHAGFDIIGGVVMVPDGATVLGIGCCDRRHILSPDVEMICYESVAEWRQSPHNARSLLAALSR